MQQLSLFDFARSSDPAPIHSRPSPTLPVREPGIARLFSVPTHSRAASDSDPLLSGIWQQLCHEWFPGETKLEGYRVYWSTRRQKRTLASCNIEHHRVAVARELNYPQHERWLEPLLYHEMCHAVLLWPYHDKRFYALERLHPGIRLLDQWIAQGGWSQAVRSDRAKRWHQDKANQRSVTVSVARSGT